MKRIISYSLSIVLILAILMTGCSGNKADDGASTGEKTYQLKIANIVADTDDVNVGFEYFKKNIEEMSDGRIEVQIYGNRQLANTDVELADLVNKDDVQMACVAVFNMPVAFKGLEELYIFDFPYMFLTKEEQLAYANSEEGKAKLDNVLEVSGNCAIYACYPRAWLNWGLVPKDLNPTKPSDLNGYNVRTNSAQVLADTVAALGSNPTIIPFAEVYTALQQGSIQGTVQSTNHFVSENTYEVVKTFLDLKSSCMLNTTLISQSWVDSLPDDLKTIFFEAFNDYNDYMLELSNATEEKSKNTLRDKGVNVIEFSDENMKPWIEAGKAIWEKEASLVGGMDKVNACAAWLENYRKDN